MLNRSIWISCGRQTMRKGNTMNNGCHMYLNSYRLVPILRLFLYSPWVYFLPGDKQPNHQVLVTRSLELFLSTPDKEIQIYLLSGSHYLFSSYLCLLQVFLYKNYVFVQFILKLFLGPFLSDLTRPFHFINVVPCLNCVCFKHTYLKLNIHFCER